MFSDEDYDPFFESDGGDELGFNLEEDEDDHVGGGIELRAEVTAYERTGPAGKLSSMISSASNFGEMQKVLSKESVTPEDRFLIFTDAIARRLNSDNIARLTEADINNILQKTTFITGLRYKNPIAYILGYIASGGGVDMNHKRVMNVINKILPRIGEEGGVTPPDVIRYARYWVKHL